MEHNRLQLANVPDYIQTAKHAPMIMKEYIIKRSQMASGCDSAWTTETYDNIAWRQMGETL